MSGQIFGNPRAILPIPDSLAYQNDENGRLRRENLELRRMLAALIEQHGDRSSLGGGKALYLSFRSFREMPGAEWALIVERQESHWKFSRGLPGAENARALDEAT